MTPTRRYQPLIGGSHAYPSLAWAGVAQADGAWAVLFAHPLNYAGSAASASGTLQLGGAHHYAGASQASGALALRYPVLRFSDLAQARGALALGGRHTYTGMASTTGALTLRQPLLAYVGAVRADGGWVLRASLSLRYRDAALADGQVALRDGIAAAALDHVLVIQAETSAVSSYVGYPLTSFAEVAGIAYGVSPQGLYRLGGSSRNGTPIASSVRTGLMPLGGHLLSRVEDMRLVLATAGQVIVKARVVVGGQLIEHWYQPIPVPAGVTREQVCPIGKGLTSLYWQFEIHNQAGASGELTQIDLHPIPLSRRR